MCKLFFFKILANIRFYMIPKASSKLNTSIVFSYDLKGRNGARNFVGGPLGSVRVHRKSSSQINRKTFFYLSLKLGSCLYENRQCFGVPGYPLKISWGAEFFLGEPFGSLRIPRKFFAKLKDKLFFYLSLKLPIL